MKRVGLLSVLGFVVLALPTHAQRTLTFQNGCNATTFLEIGTAMIGSDSVAPLFSANLLPVDAGLSIRDKLISELGVPGVGKRGGASPPYTGTIRVFHSDSVQFWWRFDGGEWNLIEPGGSNISPFNFAVADSGSNGQVALGNVPVVSTWGLLVLAALVATAGTVIVRTTRGNQAI